MVNSNRPMAVLILGFVLVLLPVAVARGAFPSTPLLDDFNRPDGPLSASPNWADAWCCYGGVMADRSHEIDSGRIKSKNGGASPAESGASAWLPLVEADVEAYVTWSVLPTPPAGTGRGSEIQVRTQSLPDGHLNYYSCEMMVQSDGTDEIGIIWQRGEGDQEYIVHFDVADPYDAGDVVGVRIVGDLLECWRKHATNGGGFQAGDEELLASAVMPGGLGAGYIVLRTTDTADIRWDDFGGGALDAPEPPPPPPEFPATPLLDDFDRPDGPLSASPNWADAWCCYGGVMAERSHEIDSGRIRSKNASESGASAWLPLVEADVEAYVTFSVLPAPQSGTSGSEIQVRTQSLPDGHLNYYSCEMLVSASSNDQANLVWQRDEGDYAYLAQTTLSDPFSAGDLVGVRMVGERLECWRVHATSGGGFEPGDRELMLAADVPGGLGAGYIVLRTADDSEIRWDDFGGGAFPPPPEPELVPALGSWQVVLCAAALLLAARRRGRRPPHSSRTPKRS